MKLPPCHYSWQIVYANGYLDIVVTMRSLDLFIGLPYDMGMYAIILDSIANELNLIPRKVIINAAACHIYKSHIAACKEYLAAKKHKLPDLVEKTTFSNFNYKEVKIENYTPEKRIKAEIFQ